jgi:hypothetical protein
VCIQMWGLGEGEEIGEGWGNGEVESAQERGGSCYSTTWHSRNRLAKPVGKSGIKSKAASEMMQRS